PFSMVTSVRMTSATRRSRTGLAAVSTALRAAASHDSLLTPITSVTRYTLSAIWLPSGRGLAGLSHETRENGPRTITGAARERAAHDHGGGARTGRARSRGRREN